MTKAAYDDAGRKISSTPPGIGTTTYSYNVVGRTTTTIRPDGGTIIDSTNLDGSLASETGTSAIASFHSYGVTASGQFLSTLNVGSFSSPRYGQTWTDWMGRTVQTQSPGFTGQPPVTTSNEYDPATGLLSYSSKSGYAGTGYSYDSMGSPLQQGLDVSSNGGLTADSSDRITGTNSYVEFYNGAWWQRTDTSSFLTTGSGTPTTISTTRTRLSGFTAGVQAEAMSIDVEGNVTDQQTAINVSLATSTTTTTSTGFADPEIQVSTDGFVTSDTSHDQLTTKSTYDSLGRLSVVTNSRGNPTTTAYVSGTNFPYTVTDATNTLVQTFNYDNVGRKRVSDNSATA